MTEVGHKHVMLERARARTVLWEVRRRVISRAGSIGDHASCPCYWGKRAAGRAVER